MAYNIGIYDSGDFGFEHSKHISDSLIMYFEPQFIFESLTDDYIPYINTPFYIVTNGKILKEMIKHKYNIWKLNGSNVYLFEQNNNQNIVNFLREQIDVQLSKYNVKMQDKFSISLYELDQFCDMNDLSILNE